jgi:hypothetical protein
MSRIGVYDSVEESVKCACKLHCLGRGLLLHGPVGAPPCVIVDEAIATSRLGNATNRAEPELWEVVGLAPCKEADLAERNLFGQLAMDKVGGMDSGSVAAVFEGGNKILRPGGQREEHGRAPGSDRIYERGRGVRTRWQRGQHGVNLGWLGRSPGMNAVPQD